MTAVPIDPPPAPIPDYTPVGLWVPEPEPPLPVELQEPEPAKPAPTTPVVVVQRPAPERKPIRRAARKPAPEPLDPDLKHMSGAVAQYLSTLAPADRQRVLNDLRKS